MENCVWVYMTAGSLGEARSIAWSLVEQRLAACTNILPNVVSIFQWQGNVQESEEVSVIAKTTQEQVPALISHVKERHSYDCPCIVTLPISDGYGPFLQWIRESVDPLKKTKV